MVTAITVSTATESVVDAATGQLQIGGYEIGDTGLRTLGLSDMGSPANISAGGLVLQRTGNVVMCRLTAFSTGSSWVDNDDAANGLLIPAGFRPDKAGIMGISRNGTTGVQTYILIDDTASPSLLRCGRAGMAASQTSQGGTTTWTTPDAWPATLPGT